MSRQRVRAHEATVEHVKESLDKEHLCLSKAKGMIQQQLKVLQAEAATIQRIINAQTNPKPRSDSLSVQSTIEQEADLDSTSEKLPKLNLGVEEAHIRSSGDQEEMETDSESDEV